MLQSMRSATKYIFWFLAITFVGGFLLAETSGLLGRASVTPTTAVAKVNGESIPYNTWIAVSQNRAQEEEQRQGRALTLDERRRIDDEAFEQLVTSILLEQEYKKRGITVSDQEIIDEAKVNPPPQLLRAPELQTEGQFDLEKYQRFLSSPAARQQGLLVQLEGFYRNQIPQQKLYAQISSDVYVTDQALWQAYRDVHDSVQVSYVAFDPGKIPDTQVTVSDADIRDFYDKHKSEFDRPGHASVSVLTIPRTITAADTAAALAKANALRDEIVKGAKFEDVAKRESADTISGAQGGSLGKGAKGRFVKEFDDAAYALKTGELSQPVKTAFGFHIIRVDEHKGDTLSLRHILVKIQQSDSNASHTDKRADSLAKIAASADRPEKFDSAAKLLGLTPVRASASEGDPLMLNGGKVVPSVSAWAFGGAKVGETSDLFDADDGYYLARLDTISAGGTQSVDQVKDVIRQRLLLDKKLDALMPAAKALAAQAASSTLETAAAAKSEKVEKTNVFSRLDFVPGIGRLNEAVGAAFALPQGTVSAPVKGTDHVFVLRIDRKVDASREEFEKQKAAQRRQMSQGLRQQRVRSFLAEIRKQAKVADNRKKIQSSARRAET